MQTIIHVFGVDWRLLAIQIVNFLVLLFLLKRFLYTPLLTLLDERRRLIAKGVSDAEEAKERLTMAETEGAQLLKESAQKADKALSNALSSATHLKEKAALEAENIKATLLKEAALEGERIKAEALKETEAHIAKLAILGAEKILRKEA